MKRIILSLIYFTGMTAFITGCQQPVKQLSSTADIVTELYVEANGELASSNTAMLSPPAVKNQWQYKITYITPEGTNVNEGDRVISFDISQLSQKLAVKNSELKTKQKTLDNTRLTNEAKLEKQKLEYAEFSMQRDKAKRKWEQSKGLESNLESQKLAIQYKLSENETRRLKRTLAKTIESNKVKLAIAENNVQRLQNDVELISAGIKKMTIKAPKSGIVIYRPDHQGKKVSSGDTVWMGRQIIGLPSIENMIVKAQILESDAGKVALEQRVEVILDAAPERVFLGKINKLGKVFRRKSNNQPIIIFDAEIVLDKPDTDLMRPGMAARLRILTSGQLDTSNAVVSSSVEY